MSSERETSRPGFGGDIIAPGAEAYEAASRSMLVAGVQP